MIWEELIIDYTLFSRIRFHWDIAGRLEVNDS